MIIIGLAIHVFMLMPSKDNVMLWKRCFLTVNR